MLRGCGVLILALVIVSGRDISQESVYNAAIGEEVSKSVDDGTNAIFKFLGFKCPKGHRCLPVLECLPCDFGTYKADEGSDLCENCPAGCTTLMKGAVTWKECVPKCPPGFEESECGKTCTKCRPGYYKSNWKNMPCRSCPNNSNWNKNMVGMKKKSHCYSTSPTTQSTTQSTQEISTEPNDEPDNDRCYEEHGSCTFNDYDHVRLQALGGTNCEKFCQCAHASTEETGDVTYKWVEQNCPAGTLFNETILVCDHETNVKCTDTSTESTTQSSSTVPTETNDEPIGVPGDDDCFHVHGTCTLDEYNNKRLTALNGTNCEEFCQCAHASTEEDGSVTHYWVQHQCGPGTLFDENHSVCNHDDMVECTDPSTESTTQSTSPVTIEPNDEPIGDPGEDDCFHVHGTCTLDEYNNKRLTSLNGTNCEEFCQCAHASTEEDGSVTHYWVQHQCGPGTLFDENHSICNHDHMVECTDSSTESATPVPQEPNDEPIGVPGEDDCFYEHGTCTLDEYNNKRLTARNGTNCEEFCQCAHASTEEDGSVTHYWVQHQCGPGTLFDEKNSVCNHDHMVECTDTGSVTPTPTMTVVTTEAETDGTESPTQTPSTATVTTAEAGNSGCVVNDTCTKHDYDVTRLIPLFGSLCEQFCQCAKAEGSAGTDITYYWQEKTCAVGTLFDENLPSPQCNHFDIVDCSDDYFYP